jgi:Uma2 family endonuclease
MGARTIHAMAFTVEDRDVRPLTADEVLRMVDVGILSEDEPVELLHGVLTAVSPKSPEHGAVKTRIVAWLAPALAAGRCALRVEEPIAVPDRTSLPEPDLAVVDVADDPTRHPSSALLVIEVAVSSLRVDTQVKPTLFAAAGVPEYWVVDVVGHAVRTYAAPAGGRYTQTGVAEPGDTLAPRAVDIAPLDVAALLAGT